MRFPSHTPYQGPLTCYDAMITPEELLARVVYGRPKALIGDYERMTQRFFGQLFDQLANGHAAYVKHCTTKRNAYGFAKRLREELDSKLYEVGVRQDPDVPTDNDWMVFAYNRITRSMREPAWHHFLAPTQEWVDLCEAARILKIGKDQARKLAHKNQSVAPFRIGGRSQLVIRRADLVVLANRPNQRKQKKKAA